MLWGSRASAGGLLAAGRMMMMIMMMMRVYVCAQNDTTLDHVLPSASKDAKLRAVRPHGTAIPEIP